MNTAIEFKNIKKVYGNKVVLERFNFSVAKGEFVTIIGSSGCGKTTVLKMINGLIEPTSDDIFVDGSNIFNSSRKADPAIWKFSFISKGIVISIPSCNDVINQ